MKRVLKKGRVYLVGYGPGAPDLLTLRGEKILRKAGAILYDHWVDRKFLARYRKAEKIDVGKERGRRHFSQSRIHELLAEAAARHAVVVRLKGGDPFLFGRGGEEIEFLARQGIEAEIVPGVTAVLAAAAAARIPLTHRGVSSSAAVCVGHPAESIQVPKADTLVHYMAATTLPVIAQKLIRSGWNPRTPAALIHHATLPGEKVILTDLRTLVRRKRPYPKPLVMITGRTVERFRAQASRGRKQKGALR